MRVVRLLAAAPALLALQGCFFFFIPGGLISKASDKITGAKGAHCVHKNAKVGDIITLPGNGRGRVVSLSGESMGCRNENHPIRAELDLEPVGTQREPVPRQPADQNPEAIRPPA
jgi:hypothetical protein